MAGGEGASVNFEQNGPVEKLLLRGGLNPSVSSIAVGFPLTRKLCQSPHIVRALRAG